MSVQQALRSAAQRLAAAGVGSPDNDARLLAAHLLGCRPLDLVLYDEPPAPFAAAFAQHFEKLVERRVAREPLQYIIGTAAFGPLDLKVAPGVFIPRPETEVLADWAVRQLPKDTPTTVVDLCSGSGALALYIAHYRPHARVFAVELSEQARQMALSNCQMLGLEGQVQLIDADVTDPDAMAHVAAAIGGADLVVSNPPYVPESPDLEAEVYADPHQAVFSGEDGMGVIRGMLGNIGKLMRPGAPVGIEHDDTTATEVRAALAATGQFTDIAALADLTGKPRFATARRRG